MAYKAPIWEDGKSPAISAENLNNLSQAAEGAQVLYGNSAPTSSTEGAVGQFYLVVVADSDGNYPLYQCVAIANGSYVWRDTRRIPDSITSMLGIPAPGTINSALNVLANVGNLHVWKRVRTFGEPVPEVPAGYNIGTDTFPSDGNCWFRLISASVGNDTNTLHAGDVVANKDGTLVFTTSQRIGVYEGRVYAFGASGTNSGVSQTSGTLTTEYQGKFVKTKSGTTVQFASGLEENVVYYVPTDATVSIVVEGNNAKIVFSDLRVVTGYPYTPAIPAGTTTDYLTSTDRNAYPDQSAEGGEPEKPAHYTLADAVTVDVLSSDADYTATVYGCDLNSIIVNNDGSINTTSFSDLVSGSNALTMAGNWKKFSPTKAYYITSGSSNVVFTDTIFTVSAETTLQYTDGKYVLPGCRELIGHAKVEAIPPNTSITYLGQLGGGARIEVGSYVGTGTYGSSNPNTLTFGFEPQLVAIFAPANNGNYAYKLFMLQNVLGASILASDGNNNGVIVTWSAKSVTWYVYGSKSADYQMNGSNDTYRYIAIG